jgi:hypothetical protein
MTILMGWREQYDRMQRSYVRLLDIASGRVMASSDEARDALFHYFQDAYHLKDWLRNSGEATAGIEDDITNTPALALCADLCNGTKHFRLNKPPRTGDAATGFTSQHVTVRPGTAHAVAYVPSAHDASHPRVAHEDPPSPALHAWTVTSNGVHQDALTLASDVNREWDSWLQKQDLL